MQDKDSSLLEIEGKTFCSCQRLEIKKTSRVEKIDHHVSRI